MVVNAAFAKGKPKIIQALVEGLLEGNSMIRKNQDSHLKVIGETFDWDADECKAQLAKVHLANLPENEAFFNGTIDSAGSFDYIYETAALVYGEKLIGKPPGSERFVDLSAVSSLTKSGAFKGETISIAPIRAEGSGNVEATQEDIAAALLSKDISFEFAANSTKPNLTSEVNKKGLDSISKLLKVSPGSTILLRGHADGVRMTEFRKRKDFEAAGGEAEVRKGLLRLKQLSKDRCVSLKTLLEQEYKVDGSRIKIEGVGMAEPTGLGSEKDRRVEVRWFTVE